MRLRCSNASRRKLLIAAAFAACPVAQADITTSIERVKPSVIAIGTYSVTGSPPFAFRGTGFVVDDGTLVATNAHVAAVPADSSNGAALAVQVRVAGQNQFRRARILAASPEHDLALLKIEGAPLPALVLRDSSAVREGQSIGFTGFPIGNSLGFSPVTHRGMVSAITPIALPGATSRHLNEKLVRRLRTGAFDILQLDATAYPGNSGSPVFDAESGEVVGIINMVLIRGTRESALSQPSGITYAIPSNFLADLLRVAR